MPLCMVISSSKDGMFAVRGSKSGDECPADVEWTDIVPWAQFSNQLWWRLSRVPVPGSRYAIGSDCWES